MNPNFVSSGLTRFSFRGVVQRIAPAAICALGALSMGLFFAAALQPQVALPIATRQAGRLELHQPVERTLRPGQVDLFTVDATVGQFLRVVADQKGADVQLLIVDPDGKVLASADRMNGAFGPEAISAIAQSSAPLQIKVEMSSNASASGKYAILLTDLRDPTEKDHVRIAAETKVVAAVAEGHASDASIRREGIDHYIEAAKLWRDLQDGYEEALCLYAIGMAYSSLGEHQKALDYLQMALQIRHSLGDQSDEGAILSRIGVEYRTMGEMQKAQDFFQQAVALQRKAGNRGYEAEALANSGRLYSDLGEKLKALDSCTQALPLARAAGNDNAAGLAVRCLNLLYRLPAFATAASASGQPSPDSSPADTKVLLMAQAGHTASISAIAFSPDERFALTAGRGDALAILWSVGEGKEIRTFAAQQNENPFTDRITSVAFLPDGQRVVTGSRDKTVRIWDIHTGRELQRLTDSILIESISVSPKGDLIASVGSRGAHLWDTQSGKIIRSFDGHTDTVRAVAFSPDGKLLATASADRTARLWDIATGKEIRRLTGHGSSVNAITFSRDGTLLATGSGVNDDAALTAAIYSRDPKTKDLPTQERINLAMEEAIKGEHTIRLWDLSSGTEIQLIDAPAAVLALAFSPDLRYLASGGGNKNRYGRDRQCTGCEVRLLDVRSGQVVSRLVSSEKQLMPVEAVAFSPTKMLLASGDYNRVVITSTDTAAEAFGLRGYTQQGLSLAISQDSRFSATKTSLWDHQTGRPSLIYPDQLTSRVEFSPDGTTLVTGITVPGSTDGQISFWDLRTHSEIRRLSRPGAVPQAYSPDGRLLLVRSAKQLCLIEPVTGAEVRCLQESSDVNAAFFSPAGDALIAVVRKASTATTNVTTIRVWDIKNGGQLRSFEAGSGMSEAVSPVGEVIAISNNSTNNGTRLFNWKTGEMLRELYTGPPGSSISFSPDGRWLGFVSPLSSAVSIWDTSSGQEKWEFRVLDRPMSLKFGSDGRFIFITSGTGVTSVWNFATGKQACSMVSFTDGSWAVTDPDGRYDASNPDNAVGLHWVAGDEVIELGQLKQRFYTPGLLARALKGEKLPDVASIQTIKLFPKLDAQAPPTGSTWLDVKLTNRGGGIGRVIVKVNGKELPFGARGAVTDPEAPTAQLSIDLAGAIRAADGQNSVEVIAYDGRNLLSSRGVKLTWKTDITVPAKMPRLFAVVAGVSEYDNSELNLNYPAKDAESIHQALRLAGEGLFGKGQVSLHLLSTSGVAGSVLPTKEEFRKAFSSIAAEAAAQDVLVIYLAGHGVARRGIADEYYFLTKLARSTELPANDLIMLDLATVSSEELRSWCLNIKALKQVIILDTCAAGAAREELGKLARRRDLSPDQVRALELLKDSTGSHILMGSATDAVSYEASRYGQGLLTYALLQGMKGEALDAGQRVDVLKLFNFVSNRVVQLAYGIGGIQQPQISSPGGRSFPIGLLTDQDKRAIPLANAKPQLLQVQCYDNQDVDSLRLGPQVRTLLKEASQSLTRGNARPESAVVYVDEMLDIPTALSPLVRYQVRGGTLEAKILLRRDNQVVSSNIVTANADPALAAHQIADVIIRAATKAGVQ